MTATSHASLGLHPLEPGAQEDPAERLKRRQVLRRTRLVALAVLVLLGIGAARTVLSRVDNARTLQAEATANAQQHVRVTQATRAAKGPTLALPGTLQGASQSPIAARASGYVKRWTKDIGATVKKGELLAEIDTPEIDQQLTQAIAAREQAAASLALTRSTVERWEGLRRKDVVSQQDLDERRSAAAQAQANVAAADANVQRLRQMEGFKRIVAPFSGVITRRNVDVGDLIDAGGAASRPLFVLAQADALRIVVNVPQAYAQLVKTGQPVNITQGELRGQVFKGRVERTSASIDTATRTMQVEITLPNAEGRLLPGAYVQVGLPLPTSGTLVLPTNTLMFRAEGALVAAVDPQGLVKLHKVAVGRNFGETTEILDGVDERARVVLNPPDWMADGLRVTVAPPPAAASAASGARDGGAKERL